MNCCAPLVPKPGKYQRPFPTESRASLPSELGENLPVETQLRAAVRSHLMLTNPVAAWPSPPRQSGWPAGRVRPAKPRPLPALPLVGPRDASLLPGLDAHSGRWEMNYVSFISKKQSRSPFVIKFAVRGTLLYLITSDIFWLLVLETIKV